MAKLTRVDQRVFGDIGATGQFGQIGSDSAGTPLKTKDPATIQALDEFVEGLYSITANAGEPPRIEDINSLYFLVTRQIAYLLQQGVGEWSATQKYYIDSVVTNGGKIYRALLGDDISNDNTNQDPATATTFWEDVASPAAILAKLLTVDGPGSGLNADLFDNLDSERFIYGDSLRGTTKVTNFDTILKSGPYFGLGSATGAPNAGASWHVQHTQQDDNNNYAFQIAVRQTTAAEAYIRAKNVTWEPWVKLWNASNDGAGSGLDADLLDGLHASEFYTSGTNKINDSSSFTSNLPATGSDVFLGTTITDMPYSSVWRMQVIGKTASSSSVLAYDLISANIGKIYLRTKVSGSWGNWIQIQTGTSVDQRITTGGTRTETVGAMAVGETKQILWSLQNTSGGAATITINLPSGGTYQFMFSCGRLGSGGYGQMLDPLTLGSTTAIAGGSPIPLPSLNAGGVQTVSGTIKRIS